MKNTYHTIIITVEAVYKNYNNHVYMTICTGKMVLTTSRTTTLPPLPPAVPGAKKTSTTSSLYECHTGSAIQWRKAPGRVVDSSLPGIVIFILYPILFLILDHQRRITVSHCRVRERR